MQLSPQPPHPTATEISTFELLTLPIAPGFVTIARKVVQGYFLNFSNLCSGTFTFRLLLVIPTSDQSNQCDLPQDRELTLTGIPGGPQIDPSGIGNHQSILDVTGGPAAQFCQTNFGELIYLGPTFNGCAKVFVTDLYKICGGWSGLWTLLPNLNPAPNGPNLIANGRFEVRGWSSIGIFEAETKKTELLLNPELRGTYFPQSLQTAGDPVSPADLSQTQSGLALASGRARTSLQAANFQDVVFPDVVKKWITINGINPKLVQPFGEQLGCLLGG
jgi:hypothetical protein